MGAGHEPGQRWASSEVLLAARLERAALTDATSRVGLDRARIGCSQHLRRLLTRTIALAWLTLLGLPHCGLLPPGWDAQVS